MKRLLDVLRRRDPDVVIAARDELARSQRALADDVARGWVASALVAQLNGHLVANHFADRLAAVYRGGR